MYTVEKYAKVRRACNVEELSIRQAAKEFELHRTTIKKMLKNPVPPGYCRNKAVKFPVLNDHIAFIDAIMIADKVAPKKQRHTIRRIYNRLVTERNFTGGYTTVRDYVRKNYKHHKEMFVPLVHEPGTAQADFGEAIAIIGGQELKIHYLAMILPQSDHCFVKAYLRENTESFCDAHVCAFEFFGGVPNCILYDNTSIAVASILGDGNRKRTSAFTSLQSHYLFKDKFANICKGNEKGSVENFVGYARRNFMVPIPNVENIAELNAHLLRCCQERMRKFIGNHKETIAERFIRDQAALIGLPAHSFEACRIKNGKVNSESLVRFEQNDYSVPVKYGYKDVVIKGYVDKVVIACGSKTIATHSRSYEKGEKIYDPLHYLPLIERKIASFTQAAPLKKLVLPESFELLLRRLENNHGIKNGRREYIRILQLLLEFDLTSLTKAVEQAMENGVLEASCIKHIMLHHKEKRPSPLVIVSHLPKIEMSLPNLHEYSTLLTGGKNV
jgi:transposase